jgi:hypothetical protein
MHANPEPPSGHAMTSAVSEACAVSDGRDSSPEVPVSVTVTW